MKRTELKRKTPLKAKASGIKPRTRKQKRCKACQVMFTTVRDFQAVCGEIACALAVVSDNRDRARKALDELGRKELRAARERIKTKGDYMREAQAAINRYVRLRDSRLGCVSCERPATWQGQWHASHYRSRGAAPHLRFNLHNIHKACSICNNHLSGNIMGYRPELVRRIGEERVAMLEANQGRADFTIDYLKRLKRVFAKKCRQLEGRLQCSVE